MNGLTQTAFALRLGVSQGLIGQLERGLKAASAEIMRKVCQETGFPLSFFLKEPLVEFPPQLVLFRSRADVTEFEESEARSYAELVAEIALVLHKHIAPRRLTLPKPPPHSDPESAADFTRSALGIPANEPITNLAREIEKTGILILGIPAQLKGRDAFSLWLKDQPIIAVLRTHSGSRFRLNLAHELGHLVLQHQRITRAQEEKDAFRFGAALLMPEAAMRSEIRTPVTLSSIAKMKPRWKVSIQALIRRTKDLGIITTSQYNYLNAQLSAKGWKTNEPGEFLPEKPRLLRQILEEIKGVSPERLASEISFSPKFTADVIECYDKKTPQSDIPVSGKVALMKR